MTNKPLIFCLFSAIVAATFAVSVAEAQQKSLTLNIDDQDACELVLKDLPSLEFDPQTGDVSAFIESLEPCIPAGSGSAAALFLNPANVLAGSGFDLVWVSSSETGCTASSSGPAFVSGWSGAVPAEGHVSLTAPVTDGSYSLDLECDGATASEILLVDALPDEPAEITEFQFDGVPASVISRLVGDQLSVLWETENASDCTATGTMSEWSNLGSLGANGSENIVLQETGTIGITCSGSSDSDSVAPIQVNVDSLPSGCEARALPSDWVRRTTGFDSCIHKKPQEGSGLNPDADCTSLTGIWGFDWPMGGVSRVLTMGGRNAGKEYVAIEFNSGPVSSSYISQIQVNEPQAGGLLPRPKMWSISTCPADFNQTEIDDEMGPGCYRKDGTGGQAFEWGGSDSFAHPFRCAIDANQTYYLNIIYTDSEAGTDPEDLQAHPDCVNAGCGNRISN